MHSVAECSDYEAEDRIAAARTSPVPRIAANTSLHTADFAVSPNHSRHRASIQRYFLFLRLGLVDKIAA